MQLHEGTHRSKEEPRSLDLHDSRTRLPYYTIIIIIIIIVVWLLYTVVLVATTVIAAATTRATLALAW